MNPNAVEAVEIAFDDYGTWTFYEGWNGLALAVQAQTGGLAFTLNDDVLGLLDSVGVIGPVPDGWSDLGCDLLDMEIVRGATTDDNVLSSYEAGTCQITLRNIDGTHNPSDSFGGLFAVGTTVRVLARNATILDLFQGDSTLNPNDYLYRWFTGRVDVWEAEGFADENPVARITCVDDIALLNQYDGMELAPVGAGDTTEDRINRFLTNAGWASQDEEAEGGGGSQTTVAWFGTGDDPTHQATTLEGSAWQNIVLAAFGASRAVFVNGDGRVTSAPLNPNSYDTWTQVAWGCGDADDMPIVDGTFALDNDQIHNIIDGQRVGGALITVENSESVARRGPYRWGHDDLTLELDADVEEWAGFILNAVGDPAVRINSIRLLPALWPQWDGVTAFVVPSDSYVAGVFDSSTDVAAWDIVNREVTWLNGFGRRHTVTLDLPYDAGVVTDTVAIRGCRLMLDPDNVTVEFLTSSIAVFLDVFTLNDDVLGLLDRGNRLA